MIRLFEWGDTVRLLRRSRGWTSFVIELVDIVAVGGAQIHNAAALRGVLFHLFKINGARRAMLPLCAPSSLLRSVGFLIGPGKGGWQGQFRGAVSAAFGSCAAQSGGWLGRPYCGSEDEAAVAVTVVLSWYAEQNARRLLRVAELVTRNLVRNASRSSWTQRRWVFGGDLRGFACAGQVSNETSDGEMRCCEDRSCFEGKVRRSRPAISAATLGRTFYAPSTRPLEGAWTTASRERADR